MCSPGDISGTALRRAAGPARALRLRLLRLVGLLRLLGFFALLRFLGLVAAAVAPAAFLAFRFRLRLRSAALLAGVVGDVPAGPLELEGRRGDELLHLAAAGRAGGERWIVEALEDLGPLPAVEAFVLVKRHIDSRRAPSGAELVAVRLETDLDRAGGSRPLLAPRLRAGARRRRQAADELEDLESVQHLAVLGGAVGTLGADVVQGPPAVHQAEQLVLVPVEGELDELLRLVTRLEDRLFPPQPRHQRLGVGSALDALQDDLPHGDLDAYRVRLAELADAEDDAAVAPVEETPDDGLDLLADGLVDLGRGEQPGLDEQHAVALVGPLALPHGGEIDLRRDHPAALEIGAQAVVAVRRGGVDDVAFLDVDLLDLALAAGLDHPGDLEPVDRVQDLRQGGLREVAAVLKAVLRRSHEEDHLPSTSDTNPEKDVGVYHSASGRVGRRDMALQPDEAWRRIEERLRPLPEETVGRRAAAGRVLARSLAATVDVPAGDVSAMDGYALPGAAGPGGSRPVVGAVAAGP